MLTAAVVAVVVVPRYLGEEKPAGRTVCATDQLQARAVQGLVNFADWLRANKAAGFIGEVGWPSGADGPRWDKLADTWYDAADALGLPVTAWAAAHWPPSYPMALYSRSAGSDNIDTAGPQAAVVAAHPGTSRYLRGVVLADGSFGTATGSFSSTHPGRYGLLYSYESADSYTYLAAHGVGLVRLAVAWERLQPVPGGALDATELGRLEQALDNAARANLRVLVDLHSYGQFQLGTPQGPQALVLGSPQLPAEDLADLWRRLATALSEYPAVYGYDVMNEPTTLAARGASGARLWEQASQAAVSAIRAAGSTAIVTVAGYGQTSPARWGKLHPRAWIDDPLGRVLYSAHVYFDADSSGRYAATYDEELARVAGNSAPLCTSLATLKGPA
jgi:Cellulase (glycosyl hydrolase family 5)